MFLRQEREFKGIPVDYAGLLALATFLVPLLLLKFMIPIFLQRVLGLTPLQSGLTIVPALVVSAFGGTLSGRLTDLFSPRVLVIVSLGPSRSGI